MLLLVSSSDIMAICDICYCSITTPCRIFTRVDCEHDFCFNCIRGRFMTHSTCPVCREEFTHAFRWKVGEWDIHEVAMPMSQNRQTTPNRREQPPTPKKRKCCYDTPTRPKEDVENSRLNRTPLHKLLNPTRRRLFSSEPEVILYF